MFVDRQSAHPNRYKITPESGAPYYAELERADEPVVEGTALNAATLNWATGIESTDFPGCRYRIVDGETEWINPPMVASTEYRTTERHDGKPVYVWREVFTEMPEGAGSVSNYIFSVHYRPISITGVIKYKTDELIDKTYERPLPSISLMGNIQAWLEIAPIQHSLFPEDYPYTQLFLRTASDVTGAVVDCTIKYVKG